MDISIHNKAGKICRCNDERKIVKTIISLHSRAHCHCHARHVPLLLLSGITSIYIFKTIVYTGMNRLLCQQYQYLQCIYFTCLLLYIGASIYSLLTQLAIHSSCTISNQMSYDLCDTRESIYLLLI